MPENREIKVPPLGESVSEATVARWTKQAGETVTIDEILVELETDKVTLEVTAPASGVLQEINNSHGKTVVPGDILGVIAVGTTATAVPKATTAESTPQVNLATSSVKAQASNTGKLAPSVKRMVAENHLNIQSIQGTGKGERITKTDVVTHLSDGQQVSVMVQPAFNQTNAYYSANREERVKMTRLRQRIAERLKQAQNTAAILTTFNEVDMTAINNLRTRYKDTFEKKHGIKLGFMSFFVKAAIQALKENPAVNAEIDGEDIIYKNYYDIGVAVSAPQGLVVPIVRNADMLSFAEVEETINNLGIRAREGKLNIEDMTGGTFTISNGGIFGSLMSTPIINPPQTGILGMHKIQERPIAIDGKIEIRPMMYIALSYDHRIIDGKEAVTFLVRVKENIENPERLLLDI